MSDLLEIVTKAESEQASKEFVSTEETKQEEEPEKIKLNFFESFLESTRDLDVILTPRQISRILINAYDIT